MINIVMRRPSFTVLHAERPIVMQIHTLLNDANLNLYFNILSKHLTLRTQELIFNQSMFTSFISID